MGRVGAGVKKPCPCIMVLQTCILSGHDSSVILTICGLGYIIMSVNIKHSAVIVMVMIKTYYMLLVFPQPPSHCSSHKMVSIDSLNS